jgi:ABC-type sugar transport system ATPase subunit
MTVRENLSLGLRIRKIAANEIDRRVAWAAGVLGLDPLLDRKPKQLSGGQRQRVAMGRAMVREPLVFLFDEPLSNLDAALRAQMRIEIGSLQRRLETTTVYVTHDQVEAMTLGDRIVVLADGRIQQIGRPIELYSAPVNKFVAGFIGTPAMNFLPGVLEQEGASTYFATEGARLTVREGKTGKASRGPATLGIRPEHLRVDPAGPQGKPESADGETLTGRVVLVERLGGTSHVHFEVGPHRLLASTTSDSLPEVGSSIRVRAPAARSHLFGGDGRALLQM